MSLKETKQVRKNKFFTRWDSVVYIVLAAAIALSFIVLFFVSSGQAPLDHLEIRSRGERIAVYTFEDGSLQPMAGCEDRFRTEEDGTDTLLIYIYTEDGGYNLLAVDNAARTADMRDADCSSGKDCTYMHIGRAGQTIVCVPHSLVIEGFGGEDDDSGIVIG